LNDHDTDAPVQWLLCKAIARIGTPKAVHCLEDIYQHAVYYEMGKSALIGIRHWAYLQSHNFEHGMSQVPAPLIENIHKKYLNEDDRKMFPSPMQHAWTHAADQKYRESCSKIAQQEEVERNKELVKNAEYFVTLKP